MWLTDPRTARTFDCPTTSRKSKQQLFDSIALPDKSLQYHVTDPLTTVSNSNLSSLTTFQTPLEFETVATMSVAKEKRELKNFTDKSNN